MKKFLLACILLSAAGSVSAATPGARNCTSIGETDKLSGTLIEESAEWYVTDGEKKMVIHMGPLAYREKIGLDLHENSKVTVEGFIYDDELAVTKLLFDGKEYLFRDSNGVPLWLGERARQRNR